MEITETSSNLDRRSSQTEVWKEIDEQALRVFNEDDVLVSFHSKSTVGHLGQNSLSIWILPTCLATGKRINGLEAFIHAPIPGFIMRIWGGAIFMKRTALISGFGEMIMVDLELIAIFPYAYSDQRTRMAVF